MRRIHALDAARAVAIIGMMAAHLMSDPTWLNTLSSGYPSALFAILAGCSLAIVNRQDTLASRYRILVRGVILVGLGVALTATQTSISVVLGAIGGIFLVLFPVVNRSTRFLVILWALLFFGGSALTAALNLFNVFVPFLVGVYPFAAWVTYGVSGILIYRFIVGGVSAPGGEADQQGAPQRATLRWQIGGFIVGLGAAIGGFFLRNGAGFGFGSESFSASSGSAVVKGESSSIIENSLSSYTAMKDMVEAMRQQRTWGNYWDTWYGWYPHSGGMLDILFSIGMALAVICGFLLLFRSRLATLAFTPLRMLGSMALTAYVAHVISTGFVQNGWPWSLDMYKEMKDFSTFTEESDILIEATGDSTLFYWSLAAGLTLPWLWKLKFRRGPLEWVMHRLSQPPAALLAAPQAAIQPAPQGTPQPGPAELQERSQQLGNTPQEHAPANEPQHRD